MFIIFKIFIINLLILSRTFTQPVGRNEDYKGTLPDIEQAVQKEMLPFAKFVSMIPNDVERGKFMGNLEQVIRRALKADELLKNQGALENKKELAEEWAWFELMRQQIEYYEESNFPQPYDDDFESKKVVWDSERLKRKSDHELHEERRYQKFKYYLEHPPNDAVKRLRNRLDTANVAVEMFSKGIAKAYRLISAKIHDGYIKWLSKDLDDFFHQENVLIAMNILLDEMGISKKLIKKIENTAKKNKG